jgi:hypothetical protein
MSQESKQLGLIILLFGLMTVAGITNIQTIVQYAPNDQQIFYHFKLTFTNLTTADGYAVSQSLDGLQVLNQYLSENNIVWEELNNVEIVSLKGGD